MCALQWEFRLTVIERLRLAPLCTRVAVVALPAQPTLVRIDLLVALETNRWSLSKPNVFGVASVAWHANVCGDQFEIRLAVIECLAIELSDIGATSLVISVALIALQGRCALVASVKADARRAVGIDLLVAVETQPGLRTSREWLVAVGAVLFELGMSLCQ